MSTPSIIIQQNRPVVVIDQTSPQAIVVSLPNIPGVAGLPGLPGAPLSFRGVYDAGTAYVTDNLVSHDGSTWIALVDCQGVTPAEGVVWSIFVSRGADSTVPGPAGAPGTQGVDGAAGLSAYEVALAGGFVGTEAEWLLSLKGDSGTLTADQINAIQAAPAASGANPFATVSDIPPPKGASELYVSVAEKADFHAHSNKSSLDQVQGVNTGDQDLTGLTHTNRASLDQVSGVNTGDQDLSHLANKNHNHHVGFLEHPSVTDHGDGTITMGAVQVFARGAEVAIVDTFNIAATLLTAVDGTRYACVNKQTLNWVLLDTLAEVDRVVYLPYMKVIKRVGSNNLHFILIPLMAQGVQEITHLKDLECDQYTVAKGALLGLAVAEGTLAVTCGGGPVHTPFYRYVIPPVTPASRQFRNVKIGGTWNVSPGSHLAPIADNMYYQGATDPVELTDGFWTINYFYRGIENQDHIYSILSSEEFATKELADASSQIAEIPYLVDDHAVPIGRCIIQKGATTGFLVQSSFETVFKASNSIGLHGAFPDLALDHHPQYALKTAVTTEIGAKENLAAGVYSHPVITNNAGTISIAGGVYALYETPDFTGPVRKYTVAGGDFTLTDETYNYLVCKYNGGNPVVTVTLNLDEINDSDVIPIESIYRSGSFIHPTDWGTYAKGLQNKLNRYIRRNRRFTTESGVVLSSFGVRQIDTTGGIVWAAGSNPIEINAARQGVNTTFFNYHAAGVWARNTTTTQYPNDVFDDGTNLVALGTGRYAVIWVYRGVEQANHIYYLMGTGNYTLTQAQASLEPAKPSIVSSHTVLRGRIIIQKGSDVPTQIDTVSNVSFASENVKAHGDLINRDEPDQHVIGSTTGLTEALATLEAGIAAAGGIPAGVIVRSSTNGLTGFLPCEGQLLDQTTYAPLYTAVGNKFSYYANRYINGQPWSQQYSFNRTLTPAGQENITGWTLGTDLPANLYRPLTLVTNSRVYLIGGSNGVVTVSTVYTAPINADGTLGTWVLGTAFPVNIAQAQIIMTNSRVYVIGGHNGTTTSSSVYTAPINSDGTLGTWVLGTALPQTIHDSHVVVTNSRIYLLGGEIAGSASLVTYTAPINSDGTIGAWTTGASLLGTLGSIRGCVATTNQRIFLMDANNALLRSAPINPDGSLGTWLTVGALPANFYDSTCVVVRDVLYIICPNYGSSIRYAKINPDGSLGAWVNGTALPVVKTLAATFITNGRIHVMGGHSGGSVSRTTYSAALPAAVGLNNNYMDKTFYPSADIAGKFYIPDLAYESALAPHNSTQVKSYIKY